MKDGHLGPRLDVLTNAFLWIFSDIFGLHVVFFNTLTCQDLNVLAFGVSGERRGVWSLPCGTVRLSDRSAHQAEGQTAHQSHQGEGVQSEGTTDWLTEYMRGSPCEDQPMMKMMKYDFTVSGSISWIEKSINTVVKMFEYTIQTKMVCTY